VIVASLRTLLTLLLLCSAAAPWAMAANAGVAGRWTVYHISGVAEGVWSAWYTQGPWPIRLRFKCSNGAVIVNAANTDRLSQNVTAQYWDIELDRDTLESAIASKKALQNRGFALTAGQSTTFPLYRPPLCSATSNTFVFAAVYGVR
jgi:hypothetical protein